MSNDGAHTTTKKELVNRIADRTSHTKVVVKEILQTFLDEIIDELALGNRLEFREFGVFEVKERRARRAQNPRTLEKVEVPAKRVVKFKVGRLMREKVCDEPGPPARAPRAEEPTPPSRAQAPPPKPPRSSSNSPF
jgi:integration host factor subunit beta